MDLQDAEVARYQRQLILPGFDAATQAMLRSARVQVVGAGSVAGPALLFLAAAGAGTLYVDDGDEVTAEDSSAWIYRPEEIGQPRLLAAFETVRRTSAFVKVRAYGTGTSIDAALVCAATSGVARIAAERARTTGVPHVVALADGNGGTVVSVPRGEPCFTCATSPGSNLAPTPGAAASIGTLAALELILLIAGIVRGPGTGRRVDVAAGLPTTTPTKRRPGCECATVY